MRRPAAPFVTSAMNWKLRRSPLPVDAKVRDAPLTSVAPSTATTSSTNWTSSSPCQVPRISESSTWFVAAATGATVESRRAAASGCTNRTDDVYLNARRLARVDRGARRRASTGSPVAALHLSPAVGPRGRRTDMEGERDDSELPD